MNVKRIASLLPSIVPSLLLSSAILFGTNAHAEPRSLDKVIAIVDSGVVLQSEVTAMLDRLHGQSITNNQPLPPEAELKKQVIDNLINRRIQLQMAVNMGFTIGDAELDQTLEDMAGNQNQTIEQMRQKLIADGTNYERYRENVRDELTISQIKNGMVRRRVNIGAQEVDTLLKLIAEHGDNKEEFNLGNILITLPSNPNDAQLDAGRKQAERIIEMLEEGNDFRQLAMTSSAGSKALEGGEQGFKSTNEMPSLFADAIRGHNKNDIIGPIQSGAGFHVLTIFDIKGRETVEVNEVKSRHILIKPSIILSEDKAQSMLKAFTTQIQNGEKTFGELAKEYSEDPGSALKDGVVDFTNPDVFDPAYKDKVNTLPKGEISQPFRSSFGWHIVEVMDRRVQDATEKRKRDQAYRMIFNRKFNEEAENWYHEIRAQAYVEILPEN